MRIKLRELQTQHRKWMWENFGNVESYRPLLGVMEEVGELAHAHLKQVDGIRTEIDPTAAKRDAVGDIVIFLAGYCSQEGIDLESAVAETWERVKQRNYRATEERGRK